MRAWRPERSPATRAAVSAVALLATSCFSEKPEDGTGPDGTDVVVIEMTNQLTFSPAHVEVEVGQTIEWRNVSSIVHSATTTLGQAVDPDHAQVPPGAERWDSGLLTFGQSYRRTLTVAGDYTYFCIPHEATGMIGTITVREPSP